MDVEDFDSTDENIVKWEEKRQSLVKELEYLQNLIKKAEEEYEQVKSELNERNNFEADEEIRELLSRSSHLSMSRILDQKLPIEPQQAHIPTKAFSISTFSNISGITFSHFYDTLLANEHKCIRSYKYVGDCYGIQFTVEFVVDEDELEISQLKITLPTHIQRFVAPFIEDVSKSRALLPFFASFSQYAEKMLHRQKYFEFIRTHYNIQKNKNLPDESITTSTSSNSVNRIDPSTPFVVIPGGTKYGTTMIFQPYHRPIHLLITWDIKLEKLVGLVQNIDLKPIITKNWSMCDQAGISRFFSQNFLKLIEHKGITMATHILFQLVLKRYV
eukprot:TRINITY_DN6580_c0_g1_i1.p1 TRINITY_DN6580_c0_g1~~TRINITY_DN6580_c0_g1_i1.p1  ORF type:complete len:330 (+),score=38.96 TRINITY_DN6580_c0_g1_i1:26-1015(+)